MDLKQVRYTYMAEYVCNQDYSHIERRQLFLPTDQGSSDFIENGFAFIIDCQNYKKKYKIFKMLSKE